MTKDSNVPLPRSIPSSMIIGLFEVNARMNPAVARITAEMRTAARLAWIVTSMASFLGYFFLLAR